MKVRATKTGFYESLRQVGDVFDVPDSLSAGWFVRDVIVVAAPPELGHVEMVGHGENGVPLWEPLPEPAPAEAKPENAEKNPENENVFPEKPEEVPETGKGKRK